LVGTHCGLFVYRGDNPRTAEITAQFSLGPWATEFNTAADTIRGDEAAFRNGNVYISQPPPQMTSEEYDAAVIREAQQYRADSYGLVYGPNSNSAAAYPIIMNGGTIPTVPWGALQLDYWSTHGQYGGF
jgi:hypothetical protein